ncbi:MAG: VCBS repeat-containing protein [Tannerella sp.]|nr:VCBS repeat-containing protein [Tannerella sp.]
MRKIVVDDEDAPSGVPLLRAAPYPSGYVDSTLIRCFTVMPSSSFLPKQKFWQKKGTGLDNSLYGFTVPLVGDLNGDRKPEIVALSYDVPGVNGRSAYLFIFNGQDGSVLVKYLLPEGGVTPVRSGYHGSPSQIALVDADRNGCAEIIVCFSSTTTAPYTKQIASFEVNESMTGVSEKWKTTVRYDAWGTNNEKIADGYGLDSNNYDFPIPQIVDIDGDGTAEIVVYNKVYNAKTGAYIMKFGELGLNPSDLPDKTAYIGSYCLYPYYGHNANLHNDTYYEASIAFPTIYDIDGDGKYDYIAGGKIYHHIDLKNMTYNTLNFTSIPDGRTAVADIDGDEEAEIVVQTCEVLDKDNIYNLSLMVWKPDFQNNTGTLRAFTTFQTNNYWSQGYCSYLFIGDIDGKIQDGYKLPEISMICGRPFVNTFNFQEQNMVNIPVHPNVKVENGGDGLIIPNMQLSSNSEAMLEGCLVSFTWDNTPGVSAGNRLKVSFMMEHNDGSINTGFSLFDFDNDGVMDICYRDEYTLRVISARKSFVGINEKSADIIRLNTPCYSWTGYEYPAIADVDGDGSADIIVMGRSTAPATEAHGFILVVEGANRDLAPAPAVWNQFHYHPMKINENLQTPQPGFHPLSPDYRFYKTETDPEPMYVYNSNIMQAVISSSFTSGNKEIIKPIVFTPDASIRNASISGNTLTFAVANIGNATLHSATPIRIYGDGNLVIDDTLSHSLYPNEEKTFSYTVSNTKVVYDIVIGGTLVDGKLSPGSARDCNWGNNHEQVALFLPREDLATVVQYSTVMIDVLANDMLLSTCGSHTLTPDVIVTPGGRGVLSGFFGTMRIVNNKIMYTAPEASSFSDVLDFTYTLTCEGVSRTAHVYVCIVESCTGSFSMCAGTSGTVCLKKTPSEIKFRWFDENMSYIGLSDPTVNNLTSDTTYYVKPDFSDIKSGTWALYRLKDFPPVKITVKALGHSGVDTMRWTGAVDTDWFNPGNWVYVIDGRTKASVWAPNNSCVDVFIEKHVQHYPELSEKAECRNIHLEDRAMIAGIHLLTYEKASMDFEPTSSEKGRFVMLSAPFKDMYTGDYHFPKADGSPDWGLVYMNFFQSANPDYPGSVAKEKTVTATFGSMGTPLSLGKAFNINILPDTENRRFTFPHLFTSYTGANGQSSGLLERKHADRFITDGVLSEDGELDLPVDATYLLIQVANPFAAYLKVSEFLLLPENKNKIEPAYKMWSGDVNECFVTQLATDDTMRYVIADDSIPEGKRALIAPFQSFFVMKKPNATPFNTLKMSSLMTTTVGTSPRYTLHIEPKEKGELRITAKQQSYRNATLLRLDKGAVPSYDPDEDSQKAFIDGAPVSVYTLTDNSIALAINQSDSFDMPVKLGIRLKNTDAPVTLEFSGVKDFSRQVYLIDHELDDKKIDLQKQPSYTFDVRPGTVGNRVTELNERFSLYFGIHSGTEQVEDSGVKVYAGHGRIFIESTCGSAITGVLIYDVSGATVYRCGAVGSSIEIPVASYRLYFVKIDMESKSYPVRKVIAYQ